MIDSMAQMTCVKCKKKLIAFASQERLKSHVEEVSSIEGYHVKFSPSLYQLQKKRKNEQFKASLHFLLASVAFVLCIT